MLQCISYGFSIVINTIGKISWHFGLVCGWLLCGRYGLLGMLLSSKMHRWFLNKFGTILKLRLGCG